MLLFFSKSEEDRISAFAFVVTVSVLNQHSNLVNFAFCLWAWLQGIPYLQRRCVLPCPHSLAHVWFLTSPCCKALVVYSFRFYGSSFLESGKTQSCSFCHARSFPICLLLNCFPLVVIKHPTHGTQIQIFTKEKDINSIEHKTWTGRDTKHKMKLNKTKVLCMKSKQDTKTLNVIHFYCSA